MEMNAGLVRKGGQIIIIYIPANCTTVSGLVRSRHEMLDCALDSSARLRGGTVDQGLWSMVSVDQC